MIYQVLATALLSQALIIPSDITSDGVYQVLIRDDGTEEHTKIADITARSSTEAPTTPLAKILQSRQDYITTWCGCGFNMNTNNCDAAVADMRNQLGGSSTVRARLSYYSIRGAVVAFACNRSGSDQKMDGQTYGQALSIITNRCGRYIAGSVSVTGSNFILGYMRYSSGTDFCGTSTQSSRSSC
jgi:hypothetical protein